MITGRDPDNRPPLQVLIRRPRSGGVLWYIVLMATFVFKRGGKLLVEQDTVFSNIQTKYNKQVTRLINSF